jgi:hypothetical protein
MTTKYPVRSALLSMALINLLAQGSAQAHTEVALPVNEDSETLNYITIGHGCEATDSPITAQSVIVPTLDPIVTRTYNSSTTTTTLADEIDGSLGLKGLIKPIQDKSIFTKQNIKTDSLGAIIGFVGTHGNLSTKLLGRVPFTAVAPRFAASSCANRVIVKLAVADICKKTFPPKAGTANLWIPATTPTFKDTNVDGITEAPALIIERSGPLPGNCVGDGYADGYIVTVEPSATDIDTNLPIKGTWGK